MCYGSREKLFAFAFAILLLNTSDFIVGLIFIHTYTERCTGKVQRSEDGVANSLFHFLAHSSFLLWPSLPMNMDTLDEL